jgi:hypothetical protein
MATLAQVVSVVQNKEGNHDSGNWLNKGDAFTLNAQLKYNKDPQKLFLIYETESLPGTRQHLSPSHDAVCVRKKRHKKEQALIVILDVTSIN